MPCFARLRHNTLYFAIFALLRHTSPCFAMLCHSLPCFRRRPTDRPTGTDHQTVGLNCQRTLHRGCIIAAKHLRAYWGPFIRPQPRETERDRRSDYADYYRVHLLRICPRALLGKRVWSWNRMSRLGNEVDPYWRQPIGSIYSEYYQHRRRAWEMRNLFEWGWPSKASASCCSSRPLRNSLCKTFPAPRWHLICDWQMAGKQERNSSIRVLPAGRIQTKVCWDKTGNLSRALWWILRWPRLLVICRVGLLMLFCRSI